MQEHRYRPRSTVLTPLRTGTASAMLSTLMQTDAQSSLRRALRNRLKRGRPRSPMKVTRPYPVFIAYADVPAARHAMACVAQLLRAEGGAWHLQPMLWRFDQLDDP